VSSAVLLEYDDDVLKGESEAVILIPGLDRHCTKASRHEEKT
jgi:hypothetical protein